QGFWKGGKFAFSFVIPTDYPHSPPKTLCTTKNPGGNIWGEGKVCLHILRAEWKPVLDIGAVINGLFFLFLEPNPQDPLNKEAAELMKDNLPAFKQCVQRSLRGGYVGG
ncbi:ubiquitin-conjugating enzyme/RWD-like protein, partial [Baffinella frigidus]